MQNCQSNGAMLLQVALKTGSEAVHPGYGFLSENTTFAGLCEDNGIAFIGPPASAIAAMGEIFTCHTVRVSSCD